MKPNVTIHRTTTLHRWKTLSLQEDAVTLPNGVLTTHTTVTHPGAVVLLPLLDSKTLLLVRQYRHSVQDYVLELPAGTLNSGEDPRTTASRELQEEVGHAAGSLLELGWLYPAPGFSDEKQFGFICQELQPNPLRPDEDEVIEVVPTRVEEFESMTMRGQIRDGKSLAFFLLARARGLL